jgi:hypothetical protein
MLRTALFMTVMSGGTLIFRNTELLHENEAFLVSAGIAIVLLFLIPEPGKRREPTDLIFGLMCVIALYGIGLKFRPWLATAIGGVLATVTSFVLVLAFAAALFWLLSRKRVNSGADSV